MAKRQTRLETVGSGSNKVTLVKDATTGETVRTLYNPAQRRKKYCRELSNKKNGRTGEPLRDTQLAYRSGYMAANAEQTRIFKKKNPDYQRKTRGGE